MTDAEWDAIQAAFVVLWPDQQPLLPEISTAWKSMLDGQPAAIVIQAIKSLSVEGGRFRPVVGEILRRCVELSTPRLQEFGEAWNFMHRLIEENPRTNEMKPWREENDIAVDVVLGVGWNNFRLADANDPAFRAHVRGLYEDEIRRARQQRLYAAIHVEPPMTNLEREWAEEDALEAAEAAKLLEAPASA